jgi:hypothetical protein
MNQIISQLVYPNPILIIGLLLLMLVDLLTGINKASKQGNATTSRGLRSTFDKGSTYFSFIFSLMVVINLTTLADAGKEFSGIIGLSLSGVMMITCYIEFKSIIENLIIINTDKDGNLSDFAKYFLNPLHSILILKLAKKQENG